jgi:phosphoribosyl 1,2-cyclic phosphate phosphodiesterase
MKIQFLGTAAAEGFPGSFCNCEYCQNVRNLGEKYYRTRCQSLIDGKLLIDLPADTYYHFLKYGIRGDQIETVIFTHTHADHFYQKELDMRGAGYGKNMEVEKLNLLIPANATEKIDRLGKHTKDIMNVVVAEPYKTVKFGDYEITPLKARHGYGAIDANIYLIKKGEKSFLYGHDTGYFYDEVFDYLKDNNVYLSGLTLDCCYASLPISDEGAHMGYPNNERVLNRLEELGVIDKNTKRVINHFSHNVNPVQEVIEKESKHLNCIVAYDGMTLEI